MSEMLLNKDLLVLRHSMLQYLSSDEFTNQWKIWIKISNWFDIPFEIEYVVGCIIKKAFTIHCKSLSLIKEVFGKTMLVQLQMMYQMTTNMYGFDFNLPIELPKLVCAQLVDNMLYSCGDTSVSIDDFPEVYNETCSTYETHWSAVIKLQLQWRKCISNPMYFMCKKRLAREFNEMTEIETQN
jgi:hypothetical protein|tara:strand:+ start:5243 stop:5791 length:549 start_codon:yes stop_codon:yes gene_type:complete